MQIHMTYIMSLVWAALVLNNASLHPCCQSHDQNLYLRSIYHYLPFSLCFLTSCTQSVCHHSAQEICRKKIIPPFRELKHWNNTSGRTWKQFAELLTSHSFSSVSPEPLWARHCGGHTPLSAEKLALISIHQSHTNLSSAVSQNWQGDHWPQKMSQI